MKHQKLIINTLYVLVILGLISCSDALIGDEGTLEQDIYLNYQTITDLELPFEDEWYVFNGGKTHAEGAHHFTTHGAGERYAIDFVIVVDTEISGEILRKTHTGDGKENEDHYCFGKRLNAPAAGKVLEVVNTVEDNRPGSVNRSQPGGNYIMIDHLNGETSILAHLKKGSVSIVVGDTVVKGQQIGQVGNSGASDAPHLHYQLQGTSGKLKKLGLPAQFLNFFKGETLVVRDEPKRGEKVTRN